MTPDDLARLEADQARWEREVLQRALSRFPERKPVFVTSSDRPLERVYGPQHGPTSAEEVLSRLGHPGEPPFTRGVQPTMYRGRLWTMRQYAGFQSARASNQRYRYLLEQGQTGLSVAFDLPTQIGYDSDDPLARGEVGRVGVPICTLDDMETLLDGIPLEQVSVSMTINATASILLALYVALADRRGVPRNQLQGTIQNDILKEYVARGTYRFPPRPSLRLVTDVFAFCGREVPRWNTISISGYHIREAGATAAQELAFTFAHAIAYVEGALKKGLAVEEFAGRLSFFWNGHNHFLEEVAKFRAARRIWDRILKERFGATDPRVRRMRFHAQTAGSTLTSQQPDVNVVRVTLQALAAVLGGCQSLHTNAMDEALGLPTARSARLALRTQQVIAYESGVADTIDPLGGAYAIEALTDGLEGEVDRILAHIDQLGGALCAIEEQYPQSEIERSAYEAQQRVERGEDLVVGVNTFQEAGGAAEEELGLRLDPAAEAQRVDELQAFKAARPDAPVKKALQDLRQAATGEENLMPRIIECVHSRTTLGEIAGELAAIFGEYQGGDP